MLHALLIVLTDQGTNMGCASSTTNTSTQDSDSGANLTNSDSRTRPNQQFGQNTRIKNSTKETISYEEVGETTHSNETHSKARQEITTQYKTNAYATGNVSGLVRNNQI